MQYAWAFQARRSPLIWKIYGERLDGFANDDIPSPPLNYEDEDDVLKWCHRGEKSKLDVDYNGKAMPPPDALTGKYTHKNGHRIKVPPLNDEEKLTFARWVDIGCPIDLAFDPEQPDERGSGWMLDEGRPTLTLTYPAAGINQAPVTRILLGMHDYYTGLDTESLAATADFAVDDTAAGENLASRFKSVAPGVWECKLNQPIKVLERGKVVVAIRDREGNENRIERTFLRKCAIMEGA